MGLNFLEKWTPATGGNCIAFWSPFRETYCVLCAQMSCARLKERPADTCTVRGAYIRRYKGAVAGVLCAGQR
jgi:hypothetical protein